MLGSLVLSVTYKCPIQCKYCGVNASPYRRDKMSLAFITRVIDEVNALGLRSLVVFTGGEPFLLGDDLTRAVEYATSKGFLTRVVTNAYWATSPERAQTTLARLKSAGLTEINYSCDDFHQAFIPLERIKWANEAAIAVNLPALLAVKGLKNTLITIEYLEQFLGVKLATYCKGQPNPKHNVASFGVTVPVGWESDQLSDSDLVYSAEEFVKLPCASALERIVITPRGELAICCGIGSDDFPESIIGSLHDKPLLDLLIQANDDLIVNWLALEGPYGIMRFIQEQDPTISFRNRYVNMCHLCHDIFSRRETRSILRRTAHTRVPSVSLNRAWLEAHRSEMFGIGTQCHSS